MNYFVFVVKFKFIKIPSEHREYGLSKSEVPELLFIERHIKV